MRTKKIEICHQDFNLLKDLANYFGPNFDFVIDAGPIAIPKEPEENLIYVNPPCIAVWKDSHLSTYIFRFSPDLELSEAEW